MLWKKMIPIKSFSICFEWETEFCVVFFKEEKSSKIFLFVLYVYIMKRKKSRKAIKEKESWKKQKYKNYIKK